MHALWYQQSDSSTGAVSTETGNTGRNRLIRRNGPANWNRAEQTDWSRLLVGPPMGYRGLFPPRNEMKFQYSPGRPLNGEFAEYFGQYIKFAAEEDDIADSLERQIADVRTMIASAEPESLRTPHDPYTWTITQAIGHLADQERVFGNRAGRFAAGDETELPGYDQDLMGNNGGYERCETADVLAEFEHLRCANILMFARLNEEQWQRQGTADGRQISVRAIAYLLAGHLRYHFEIFTKRLG